MKKFILCSLLSLPVFALAITPASAFFTICGQSSHQYSFTCPRFYFGFDTGCPSAWAPACAIPAAPAAPAATPSKSELPAPSLNRPASYHSGIIPTGAPLTGAHGSYTIPAYWYGR